MYLPFVNSALKENTCFKKKFCLTGIDIIIQITLFKLDDRQSLYIFLRLGNQKLFAFNKDKLLKLTMNVMQSKFWRHKLKI